MSTRTSECPCSRETAEQLAVSPEPDRVVTLVHGTFARHAPWMREGLLWDRLKALPGTTLFSRFCWTGSNSHTARLRAGEDLASHLRGLTDKFPNARHFIVGHSHGGNVMLYAMKDEALADRVTGLVTLATPFITVRRRKLHALVLISVLSVVLFGVLEAGLYFCLGPVESGKAPPAPKYLELQASMLWSVAGLILLWLFATGLSALKYRGREFALGDLISLLLRRKNAEKIRTELELLKLTPVRPGSDEESQSATDRDAWKKRLEKMFVVRPIGDEASMSLVVSQFFSWAQNRILTGLGTSVSDFKNVGWFSWLWKLVVVIALFFLLADKLPYLNKAMHDYLVNPVNKWGMGWEAIAGLINYLVWGFVAIYVLFGLVSLIGLLVLLVAGSAFGLDAMFWNHFASTTAESSPPGPARVFLQSLAQEPGKASPSLAHSGIYTDPNVIDEIVEWIKSREATFARQQRYDA